MVVDDLDIGGASIAPSEANPACSGRIGSFHSDTAMRYYCQALLTRYVHSVDHLEACAHLAVGRLEFGVVAAAIVPVSARSAI
jgi:hypothetical protein